jgi:chloride channel protein, CIC family
MPAPATDPATILRSRSYVGLLVVAAILGVPISAAAYGFLALVGKLQSWVYTGVPQGLGLGGTPWWWPLPLLTIAGVLVGLTIRYLPGTGGHSPADGFKAGGVASPVELPGIALAALATLSLGAVLGPEAPLIALGGGVAARPRRWWARRGASPPSAPCSARPCSGRSC